MKRSSIQKPLEAALTNKQNRPAAKPSGTAKARIGAALCLPLLLLPAAVDPAYAAVPTAQEQRLPAAGETITLQQSAPYYAAPPIAGDRASLGVSYYEQPGAKLTVTGRRGELLQVVTPLGQTAYVPLGYAGGAAALAEDSAPVLLRLKPDAELRLFPGGQQTWPASLAPSGAVSAVCLGDGYGLSLPAEPGYADGAVVRPALLWVDGAGVASAQPIASGVLAAGSEVPADLARSLTETALQPGMPQQRVLELLGEPYSRLPLPHVRHLSGPPESAERGTLWRYENESEQLTVSFDEAGTLLGWDRILPKSDAAQAQIRSAQPPYAFKYDFRNLPLARSISPEPLWRSQSPLDVQSLAAASDGVLLVHGSQGGPATGGALAASTLTALDRTSGERLWQRSTGGGLPAVVPGADGRSVLALSEADPQSDAPATLRSLRLSDGAVRWSREAPGGASARVFAAGTSALLGTQPGPAGRGTLTAIAERSGEVRWTKTFADPYTVLNAGSGDPYVLIRQGSWIQALDPVSSRPVWSLKTDEHAQPPGGDARSEASDPNALEAQAPNATALNETALSETALDKTALNQEASDPEALDPQGAGGDLFARPDGTRWVTFGGERVRLNTANGDIVGRYPLRSSERADPLADGNVLIRRAVDTADYDSGSLFESVLYDTRAQREIWSVPGRASRPLLVEDRLYVLLNGVPAALSAEDGQLLWKTQTADYALTGLQDFVQAGSFIPLGPHLLLPYGPDLLAFDAADGRLRARIDGFFAVREDGGPTPPEGLLNADGGAIYAGSANGSFTAWDAEQIKALLAP
ncbi:PQQ-binding-like beta-propeller repeat protein [Saccharibacillus brassicae]|uniref:PQQ-binding-like beta-propeller repeat protein n=1 Tax=Saccharibacillus brassicae TaxID=2583377 RepID=A0A4Y6V047_SACBS|nr:PQQ-binding-like beta-propeller repeat protein [Saccharibacillus brassicae]QDH22754.1 PQQ-binding-like beta-propeller repeat protein [Saccharibacillus brassicae]